MSHQKDKKLSERANASMPPMIRVCMQSARKDQTMHVFLSFSSYEVAVFDLFWEKNSRGCLDKKVKGSRKFSEHVRHFQMKATS